MVFNLLNKTAKIAFIPATLLGLLTLTDAANAAGLRFGLDNGSGGIDWVKTVMDGDANDIATLPGVVAYNNSIGSFLVNVATGISKPLLGSDKLAHIDLNSVNVSGAAGDLYIAFSDTDFVGTFKNTTYKSLIGGTTNGTVTAKTFLDNSNTLFGEGIELANFGTFSKGAFSNEISGLVNTDSPYSLTSIVKVSHTGAYKVSSFDLEVQQQQSVPEPASAAALLALGLVGAATGANKAVKRNS
ncbi:MAG: hypothetical protein ACFCU5_08050 [Pleurocapsa sp.]